MPRFFRDNGLSIAMFGVFFFALIGQYLTGFEEYNSDQREHRQPTVSRAEYLTTGHFIEAVFENWESEFLQMAAYVLFTVFLIQRGSSESRKPDVVEREDIIPEQSRQDKNAPYPVRRGGFILKLYQNSLSIAFVALFAASFVMHAYGGAKEYNQEQSVHGEAEQVSTIEYMGTSRFWFESFQNWQSEFFSMGMMVVLSIFLRQKGSPESKPVDSPHSETGRG
jgi:hypothetical protein